MNKMENECPFCHHCKPLIETSDKYVFLVRGRNSLKLIMQYRDRPMKPSPEYIKMYKEVLYKDCTSPTDDITEYYSVWRDIDLCPICGEKADATYNTDLHVLEDICYKYKLSVLCNKEDSVYDIVFGDGTIAMSYDKNANQFYKRSCNDEFINQIRAEYVFSEERLKNTNL